MNSLRVQHLGSLYRPQLTFIFKIAFVVLVFWFLSSKNLISFGVLSEAAKHPKNIILGVVVALLNFFLGAIRFGILARAQKYTLSMVQIFKIHVVGQFFNVALPGAVTGDLVKSFYFKKNSSRSASETLGILLFDRIIGLSSMIFTSTLALYSTVVDVNSHGTILLRTILTVLTVGVVAFFAYLFFVTEEKDPLYFLLNSFEKKWKFFSKIKGLYLGVKTFHDKRVAVAAALVLSLLIQTFVGLTCYQFALAIGETQLHQMQLYAVVPIGLLVTVIPILPGGVGTGHGAFSYLFKWIGSNRGADIFSLYALFNIVLGGLCGLYYLRFKQDNPRGE